MALLDLSLVTRTLINLIQTHVESSPAWSGAPPDVSPLPPDKLSGGRTIGLYLYHVVEDPGYKNAPPPGSDPVPVRHTPMALQLYYLLTAHSSAAGDSGPFREQLMMGCAMKALRDYPIINDHTQVAGVKVMHPLLMGGDNRLRLVLRPVQPEDAVTYWTAGSSPLRLSAYYQVSVALLEPVEPASRAGRVLSYGVYTFTRRSPRLDSSYHILTYTIPGEVGSREVELRPAQVPIGGKVVFTGSGLSGDRTTLMLLCDRWDAPVEVGLDWGVTAAHDQVFATVQPFAGSKDILPGVYSAEAVVVTSRAMPDGRVREFEHLSNRSPFTIAPRIDAVGALSPSGEFTVTGAVFKHTDLAEEDVRVYLGDARLATGTVGGLNRGEFAVEDAATLHVRLPSSASPGDRLLFRLLVGGVESPPQWILVP